MTLLVDVGNTRIKWATLEHGRLVNRGSAVHRDAVDAALAAFGAALPPQPRVIAANVAGEAIANGLAALVAARPGASLELVATSAERFGVRCAYSDPSRLGVDRWVAVLAAHHAARAAACVINAGTAVTFDAVDAGGAHLGGLIMPGAGLFAAALDRNTRNIGPTAPAPAVARGLDLLGAQHGCSRRPRCVACARCGARSRHGDGRARTRHDARRLFDGRRRGRAARLAGNASATAGRLSARRASPVRGL